MKKKYTHNITCPQGSVAQRNPKTQPLHPPLRKPKPCFHILFLQFLQAQTLTPNLQFSIYLCNNKIILIKRAHTLCLCLFPNQKRKDQHRCSPTTRGRQSELGGPALPERSTFRYTFPWSFSLSFFRRILRLDSMLGSNAVFPVLLQELVTEFQKTTSEGLLLRLLSNSFFILSLCFENASGNWLLVLESLVSRWW